MRAAGGRRSVGAAISQAALIVSRVGPRLSELVPDLIPLLGDEDYRVFGEAIRALDAMGEAAKPAVPALREIAADHDEGWRRKDAAELIDKLTRED